MSRGAGLVAGGAPGIGYVGWVGEGNLGDEAIMEAHRRALSPVPLRPLPVTIERPWVLRATARLRRRDAVRAVLLGGGTLLGRQDWRQRLERVASALDDPPLYVIGAGVEDPDFVSDRSFTDRDELRRWRPVLERCRRVSVRGPRSHELLQSVGIDAPIVGDPALLLGEGRRANPEQGLLGVSLARPEARWASGEDPVAVVGDALGRLATAGWRFRLLALDRRDRPLAERLGAQLGPAAELWPAPSVDAALSGIGDCDVLLGERLHAVVLAAALGVPALSLDYRPKCTDFQLSIGRGDFVRRTDRLEAGDLVETLGALSAQRDRHVREIGSAVDGLRARLKQEEGHVRHSL